MTLADLQRRVRDLAELADLALDWVVNPTSDAPACVPVGDLRDELADLDRDLTSDLLNASLEPRTSGASLTEGAGQSPATATC